MSALFRDDQGVIEFVDGLEPTYEAIEAGIMTYQILGVSPITGNRIAEALITKKGQEILLREMPVEHRKAIGGVQ